MKQHYVPKFYLERFIDGSGKNLIFNREFNELKEKYPSAICYQKDYYGADNTIEEAFSKIETFVAQKNLLGKLIDKSINSKGKFDLATFISLQMMRTPFTEELLRQQSSFITTEYIKLRLQLHLKNPRDYNEYRDDMVKKNKPFLSKKKLGEFLNDIGDNNVKITPNDNKYYTLGLSAVKDIAIAINELSWTIYKAPRTCQFITSDNPVFTLYGMGLQQEGAVTLFALDKKYLLCIINDSSNKNTVVWAGEGEKKLVCQANQNIAENSYRYVIAANKRLLARVVCRTKLSEKEYSADERLVKTWSLGPYLGAGKVPRETIGKSDI